MTEICPEGVSNDKSVQPKQNLFRNHFSYYDKSVITAGNRQNEILSTATLGAASFVGSSDILLAEKLTNLSEVITKQPLCGHLAYANKQVATNSVSGNTNLMTSLESDFYGIVSHYVDLYYPKRTFETSEELRFAYCLHSLNHILKTRSLILQHNMKLQTVGRRPHFFQFANYIRMGATVTLSAVHT